MRVYLKYVDVVNALKVLDTHASRDELVMITGACLLRMRAYISNANTTSTLALLLKNRRVSITEIGSNIIYITTFSHNNR